MPSLKEVKSRIGSVISTQQITKAMKMVAAAKLRKSQERITQMRPFAQKLSGMLQNLSSAQEAGSDNWYAKPREARKILIVAVSSDRGLCGSFNSTVFKGVNKLINDTYDQQFRKGDVTILPLGRKAFDFFAKRKVSVVDNYVSTIANISFETVSAAAEYLMDAYKKGTYDKIEIVYNEFKNVATQILRIEQFLPVLPPKKTTAAKLEADYIYQPDREQIINGLIPKSLKIQLFKAVLDSNASENGARMTAMDKATENAEELLKTLKISYNRARQAAITTELTEIVSGAAALQG